MKETLIKPNPHYTQFTKYSQFKPYFNKSTTTKLWMVLLKIQCEISLRTDLKFFFNSEAFQKAESVLDLGCGPGDLMQTLNDYFPGKQYTGVDISENYIKTAKYRFKKHKNIKFICDDIYNYKGRGFDYIILRLVAQHLPDNLAMLKCLKPLLARHGGVLTIDTNDSMVKFSQPMPVMAQMYKELAKCQAKCGGSRRAIDTIEDAYSKFGFKLTNLSAAPVSTYTKDEKKLMLLMFVFAVEIFRRKFGVIIDQQKLHQELSNWHDQKAAYGQLGMKYLEIKRRA